MKKLLVSLIFVLAGLLSGCGLYMTEGQYNRGLSLTPATSYEWARVKQDKLALEKVQALPAYTASANGLYSESPREIDLTPVTAGFRGYVKNFSHYRPLNFKVCGPETKSWLVPPGVMVDDYLIPGLYTLKVYDGGNLVGRPGTFRVSAQIHYFEGRRDAHWYVFSQW